VIAPSAKWLVAVCVAVSVATAGTVTALLECRAQRDIDSVAESALEGFDAIDRRLRAVERLCR
jgi:hypothetical protein